MSAHSSTGTVSDINPAEFSEIATTRGLHQPKWDGGGSSFFKRFRFTENTNFEFRAEFLNAINNSPFRVGGWAADNVTFTPTTNPGGLSRTDFGQLPNGSAYQDTSTTNDPGGRLIQIVLRLNF